MPETVYEKETLNINDFSGTLPITFEKKSCDANIEYRLICH